MKQCLDKGHVVMIYEDPITCRHPEGEAFLIECLIPSDGTREYWRVRFTADNFKTSRWVNVTNH